MFSELHWSWQLEGSSQRVRPAEKATHDWKPIVIDAIDWMERRFRIKNVGKQDSFQNSGWSLSLHQWVLDNTMYCIPCIPFIGIEEIEIDRWWEWLLPKCDFSFSKERGIVKLTRETIGLVPSCKLACWPNSKSLLSHLVRTSYYKSGESPPSEITAGYLDSNKVAPFEFIEVHWSSLPISGMI